MAQYVYAEVATDSGDYGHHGLRFVVNRHELNWRKVPSRVPHEEKANLFGCSTQDIVRQILADDGILYEMLVGVYN